MLRAATSSLLYGRNTSYWIVVYVNSRFEKKTAKALENRQIEVFLPLKSEIKQWSDRKKKVESPLIPRVLFVRHNESQMSLLYNTPGISGILRFGNQPARVFDYEIENLKMLLHEWNGDFEKQETNVTFSKGELVQVVKGPFSGLIGELIDVKGKHRISVKINALNVEYQIDISKAAVKKLMEKSG